MSLQASEPLTAFSERACGHRVPTTAKRCSYCQPPRLSAEPLALLLRQRLLQVGQTTVSVELATRLGMDFDSVDRQIRRILSGDVQKVEFHTGDSWSVALGQMPASVWGSEWDSANPVEPYGDEEFD